MAVMSLSCGDDPMGPCLRERNGWHLATDRSFDPVGSNGFSSINNADQRPKPTTGIAGVCMVPVIFPFGRQKNQSNYLLIRSIWSIRIAQ